MCIGYVKTLVLSQSSQLYEKKKNEVSGSTQNNPKWNRSALKCVSKARGLWALRKKPRTVVFRAIAEETVDREMKRGGICQPSKNQEKTISSCPANTGLRTRGSADRRALSRAGAGLKPATLSHLEGCWAPLQPTFSEDTRNNTVWRKPEGRATRVSCQPASDAGQATSPWQRSQAPVRTRALTPARPWSSQRRPMDIREAAVVCRLLL